MADDVIPARPRNPDPTPQQIAAQLDGMVATAVDDPDSTVRALVTVIVAEFNRHSAFEASMLSAVASATSLADLKTQFAALNTIPQRTLADLRTAIRNSIGS